MKYSPSHLLAISAMSWIQVSLAPPERINSRLKLRGRRNVPAEEPESRLYGAERGKDHEFPFMITGLWCQGSLVRKNWMLTAAHCFLVNNPVHAVIKAGVANESVEAPGEVKATVTKLVRHPEYDRYTLNNDLALLKFEPPFEETETVKIIPLVSKGYQGEDCAWIISFLVHGEAGAEESGVVHKVDVPIRTSQVCTKDLDNESPTQYNESTMLCAGYDEGGKDACQRDSGSPLIIYQDGRHVQVGITSWGIGCALPHRPGVFTRVSNYVDWIQETTANN